MTRAVVLLLAALSVLASAQANGESRPRPRWILHAALLSGQYGDRLERGRFWPDFRGEVVALGLGRQASPVDIILSTRLMEIGLGSGGGDYLFGGGILPLYLNIATEVSDRRLSPRPALHAFVSVNPWPLFYRTTWVRAGVGAKWRVFVVSPELELSYIYLHAENGSRNALSAFFKLELGGWWLLGRKNSP